MSAIRHPRLFLVALVAVGPGPHGCSGHEKGGDEATWTDGSGETGEPGATDTGTWSDIDLWQISDNQQSIKVVSVYYDVSGDATVSDDRTQLVGAIQYYTEIDGQPACDTTIGLDGESYTGTCEACEFAFRTDAAILDDQSTTSCQLSWRWSYLYDTPRTNPIFAFAEEDAWWVGESVRNYYDVVFAGYSVDYRDVGGAYYPGPYYATGVLHAQEEYPSASFGEAWLNGNELTWGFTWEDEYSYWDELQACDGEEMEQSEATEPYDGTQVTGSVTCYSSKEDGWAVAASEGDTVSVSVDTSPDWYNSDAAFDPIFLVNDPDGCTVVVADNNFACGEETTDLSICPAAQFTARKDGTYEIWILSTGYYCDSWASPSIGSLVNYTLSVNVTHPGRGARTGKLNNIEMESIQ